MRSLSSLSLPPFFFCFSLLQDSKMLNNAASYIFKVWLEYLRMYTGSYRPHSHSRRARPAVLFAVWTFTLKLLHVSKRNRKFHRNGKSQKEQVLLFTLQSTEINTNLKGTDTKCTVGTEMRTCTKEMSVFRFTQTEVNKSHPKWFLTTVITHSLNSGFSFLS